MPKLHELLAVEGDLDGTYKKVLEEAKNTFAKKPAHFFGRHKKLEMFDENAPKAPDEFQEMVTTVHDKLEYVGGHVVRYLDAVLQKEKTNQAAKGDIMVDGAVIAKGLPATFLLGLETRLKTIRAMYEAAPTLPPGIKWEEDPNRGSHVFVMTNPEEKFKTAKTFQHKILVPAQFPKEGEGGTSLPAQIEKWEEVENVGKYSTETWSGMISTAEKSVLLGRIDKLIRAVKKGRQRANTEEVVKASIGDVLLGFIHAK